MNDRIHQPYRASSCPLLPPLLPLAGSHGILGAALSGAGPAVLVVVEGEGASRGPLLRFAVRSLECPTRSFKFAVSNLKAQFRGLNRAEDDSIPAPAKAGEQNL